MTEPRTLPTDLTDKIAIVTGANTGIGKATAHNLAARGARVIIACRDTKKGEAAKADILATARKASVEVMALDLASPPSILAFAAQVKTTLPRLDILVNNAGVFSRSRQTTPQGHELTFGVNHLGTFLLTRELLPLLEASAPSRIVVLSSAMHYRGDMVWDDLMFTKRRYSGITAYNQSKLANVLFTKALARRLAGKGVTVNAVHPGVVATELTRDVPKLLVKLYNRFLLTPARGAVCSLHVATSPTVANVSGEYFSKSKTKKASRAALDETAQERLWKLSEELLAVAAKAA